MPEYELVTILSPILSQEQVTNTWDRLNAVITADGGNVTHQERWGTRRLAYPIRKAGNRFLEGNYHLTRFETDGSRTRQIEAHLRLSENIIVTYWCGRSCPLGHRLGRWSRHGLKPRPPSLQLLQPERRTLQQPMRL